MNRIILIGNGFDLAHGLKTSYIHFINDFWKKRTDEVKSSKEWELKRKVSNIYFELGYDKNLDFEKFKNNCEYRLEKLKIKEISETGKEEYKYNNYFLQEIDKCNNNKIENWSDIEKLYFEELKKCKDKFEKRNITQVKKLNDDFNQVKIDLKNYLESEVKKLLNKSGGLKSDYDTDLIGKYTKIIYDAKAKEDTDIKDILLLNFNYTCTEKFYEKIKNTIKINHIHGELKEINSMIFGYGDELSKDSKGIENLEENEFLKNVKSVNYSSANNYADLGRFINRDKYEIIIMGHSCGNSDRTLLNMLFEHPKCEKIKVCLYFDGNKDDFDQKSINIYRNFNNKKVYRERLANKKLFFTRMPNKISDFEAFIENYFVKVLENEVDYTMIKTGKTIRLKPYRIGKFQVTQKLWKDIMGKSIQEIASDWRLRGEGDNFPMYLVSWYDCLEFCNKLSEKYDNLTPYYKYTTEEDIKRYPNDYKNVTANGFRLPDNAEWEYAAKGGDKSKNYQYSGSNIIDDVAWYGENSDSRTHEVGTKMPNELGIYDMSGNVWEWCEDLHNHPGASRMLRGGSWNSNAERCAVSCRGYSTPGNRGYGVGFRLVLPP